MMYIKKLSALFILLKCCMYIKYELKGGVYLIVNFWFDLVWFGLVWVYGISNIVGYLTLNLLYTFILDIYDL